MARPASIFHSFRLAGVLLAAAAVLAVAPAARAQDCLPPGAEEYQSAPVCHVAPRVAASPSSAAVAQPSVQVTMTAEDERIDGDSASFRVFVGQTDVTAAWGVAVEPIGWGTGTGWRMTSRGTVALSDSVRSRTVRVRMCDIHECSEGSATYTLSVPGVEVTPDASSTYQNGTEAVSQAFVVRNTGTVAATFDLRAECRTAAGSTPFAQSCAPQLPSVTLNPGTAASIAVLYQTGTEGGVGTVKLTAVQQGTPGIQDAGWVDVALARPGSTPSEPVVNLLHVNAGTAVERDLCVAASAGAGAAYECGDLRLVHAMPAVQTYGKARAPVLMYNSQHAHPRPIVYANVTLPAGSAVPDSVRATLSLWNGATVTRAWNGQEWRGGTTRRIALQFDALEVPTGVYGYSLQVTNHYGGTPKNGAVLQGQLAIVNRRNSPYGPGWWVAGMEQLLYQSNGSFVWIGGDGSTRLYNWVAPGIYTPAAVDRPDTLIGPGPGTEYYVRKLPGGAQVRFNTSGQHIETRIRLQHVTRFYYHNTWTPLLDRVAMPAPGADEVAFRFGYSEHTGRLFVVDAPGVPGISWGRRYTYVYQGAAGVDSIRGPDNHVVRFGYGAASYRVTSRTDRRGTATHFAYDAAGKLSSASLHPGGEAAVITQGYQALEGKGLAASVGAAEAYTRLDGPRTDVADHTYLWLDRWGAPLRIRDALGAETAIIRGSTAFPALVTEVVAPNGLRSTAQHDARGRVHSSTVHNPLGDGRNVLTTYAYDDRWDAPTTVSTYGVQGSTATLLSGITHMQYDGVGNLSWQQQGEDPARRASFRYYPSGQLRAVQSPADAQGQVAVDSLVYDGMGNVAMTVNPLRFLTLHYRDALGRDTLTITPIDSATSRTETDLRLHGVRARTEYDVMGRVTRTETIGPARTHPTNYNATFTPAPTPEQRLLVVNTYDPEGAPQSVVRWASGSESQQLSTTFDYDGAGRKTFESSTQDGPRSFAYDPAGNLVTARTPRGFDIQMQYDALGRMTRRSVPAVAYGRICDQTIMLTGCAPFPRFPNAGDGYVVPEEWTYFRYDSAGNQAHAENRDAIVRRGYYPNGALRTDSTYMRVYTGTSFGQHVYGLEYGYDLAGRVSWMRHPANLAGSGARDQYGYDPVTGALAGMTDRLGHGFSWTQDNAGLPRTMGMPGGITETMSYDPGGRMTSRTESGPNSGTLHAETLRYDARGKITRASNGQSVYEQWYSSQGALVANDWQNLNANVARITDQFRTDPLGNTTWRKTSREGAELIPGEYPEFENVYQPTAGRLTMSRKILPANPPSEWVPDSTTRAYDASGNVTHGYHRVGKHVPDGTPTVGEEEESRSYYSADDRLVALQKYVVRNTGEATTGGLFYQNAGVWEEYRYDPLGRRILVRTRADGGMCGVDAWTCTSSVTRFVWAGDQLLWELKVPGQEGANLESTSASGNAYGQVSYTHATGIDRPLVITKNGTSIVPHQNWRGQFAKGTYASGPNVGGVSDCASYPAQNCVPIQWPGERTTVYHELTKDGSIQNWFGGLVDGMRDASGQMYMRNRYYDPATGQFTQTDPIGLAGGLNAYGFANGDPVSYSDPYGLSPECLPACAIPIAIGLYRGYRVAQTGYRVYRAARTTHDMLSRARSADATLPGGAVATKSHTTAEVEIGRYGDVRVDWEEPTSGGDPGNVHVQNSNGRVDIGKIYIRDADDVARLPEAIRNNERIQRGIRRALEQLERQRQSQSSTPTNR